MRDSSARQYTRKTMSAISLSLNLFRFEHHRYPSAEEGLDILVKETFIPASGRKAGPYMESLPLDGWGNEFGYIVSTDGFGFKLVSFGRDGRQDGEGYNKDEIMLSDSTENQLPE